MPEATWIPWTPAFNSVEDTRYGNGQLTTDYTQNVDTRWQNHVVLGPLLTVVDCAAAGGTVANTNSFAMSGTINAVPKLFAGRGTKWAKIRLSSMALLSDGTETATAERITGMRYTQTSAGTQEISAFMAGTAYRVITTANDTATDTHSANDDAELVTIAFEGWPADRIIGLQGNVIKATVLTGGVTMDNPNFSTLATIAGPALTPTGGALDGKEIIAGYNEGPYFLDSDFNRFRPLIAEIDQNSSHCAGMTTWYAKGVMIPLADGMRYQKYLNGRSVGPETWPENTSPIQGKVTGGAGTNRWFYMVVKNEVTDDFYVCACRESTRMGREFDFFPIIHVADIDCDAIEFIGNGLGARTNPTMVLGHDDDVAWFTIGRMFRETDDTNYTYATSGTWYGTEMRRSPTTLKRVRQITFETAGCNESGETITVNLRVTDERGVAITEQVGAPITNNGKQILEVRDELYGWRIKPQFVLASNTSSASPSVESEITISWDDVPLMQDSRVWK